MHHLPTKFRRMILTVLAALAGAGAAPALAAAASSHDNG